MAIDFDFEAPCVYASATGIAAGYMIYYNETTHTNAVAEPTPVAVVTIPMATALFPLQSGRIALVDAEWAAITSDGHAMRATQTLAVSSSGIDNDLGSAGSYPGEHIGGDAPGGAGFPTSTINGSGDLVLLWTNWLAVSDPNDHLGVTSSITQDVSVRVKVRWVGA